MTWGDLNFLLESVWWGGVVAVVVGARVAVAWSDRPGRKPGHVPTMREREAEALRRYRSRNGLGDVRFRQVLRPRYTPPGKSAKPGPRGRA